jgi:multicomponent Na+:H+ antiporter subunit A
MLAALSSAGFPPFLGFVSKELLLESALLGTYSGLITPAAVLVSMVLVALALLVGVKPFFRSEADLPRTPHEPPVEMWLGPLILGGLGLSFGLVPGGLHRWLLEPAVGASLGKSVQVGLPPFHLLDIKILLSFIAFLGGGLIFWWGHTLRRVAVVPGLLAPLTPGSLYEAALNALETLAAHQTRFFQSGRLLQYLLTVIITVVGLLSWSLLIDDIGLSDLKLQRWTDIRTYEAIIAVVVVVATLVVVTTASRLVAVVALGVVGYGVALTFLVFSAPDLAMTQFAIETLSVILLVLVLFNLPKYRKASVQFERVRDAVAALAVGSIATLMVLFVTSLDRTPRLVSFFAENSYLLAKGRNVVNVILVDFRGFDTLGEITLLSVGAVGVFALVKLKSRSRPHAVENE